jgi:rhodanese-related sulfurtransferase
VRETKHHVAAESKLHGELPPEGIPTQREVFWRTTLFDKNLSSVSQAGLVNNLNDGMAWGLFPLFFTAARMDLGQIGTLAAIYPATWGVAQLFTGAWSDRVGRKWLIAAGMWVQAVGIVVVVLASGFAGFATGAALLGVGTAMVYPTLLAAIGDVAHPSWRASSVGVYRLWRDLGYAIGALLAGVIADALRPARGDVGSSRRSPSRRGRRRAAHDARRCVPRPSAPRRRTQRASSPRSSHQVVNAVIVDVRSPEEFARATSRAPSTSRSTRSRAVSELPKGPPSSPCAARAAAAPSSAAEQLRASGFSSARSLCGGTQAWMQLTARGT